MKKSLATLLVMFVIGCGPSLKDRLNLLEERFNNLSIDFYKLRLSMARKGGDFQEELEILKQCLNSKINDIQLYAIPELSTYPPEQIQDLITTSKSIYYSADNLKKARLLDAFIRFNEPVFDDIFVNAAKDQDVQLRQVAAYCLRFAKSQTAQEAILMLLDDPDRQVRLQAIESAGLADQGRYTDIMMQLAGNSRDDQVVEKCVKALGLMKAQKAVPFIIDLLYHSSIPVRWAAINSLASIADRSAIPHIRKFVDRTNPDQIREVAIKTLGRLKDREKIPWIIDTLKSEQSIYLREALCEALKHMTDENDLNQIFNLFANEKDVYIKKYLREILFAIPVTNFETIQKITEKAVASSLKADAHELLKKISALATTQEQKTKTYELEQKFADYLFDSGDFKLALSYYKNLGTVSNSNNNLVRLITCYKNLGDLESALKMLRDLTQKHTNRDKEYFTLKIQLIEILYDRGEHATVVEEAWELIIDKEPSLKEYHDRIKKIYDQSGLHLTTLLGNEQTKQSAIANIKKLGKKAVPFLIDSLKNPGLVSSDCIEILNSICSTTYSRDIVNDSSKLDQAIEAWKLWYEKIE